MNIALEEIIRRADAWPEEVQEEAAYLLSVLERELAQPNALSDADRGAIDQSLDDMRQGRLATIEDG
ncbi:MAG: hypothetical protein IT537_17915 [Hyphomicrobiales bacterium]|nr:hypothetical protein [Hyphomicrobiales bacterium]